tara:strand:- start:60 stop:233 length:174 start_codon:yes stop_codon:yes gene_type:complete
MKNKEKVENAIWTIDHSIKMIEKYPEDSIFSEIQRKNAIKRAKSNLYFLHHLTLLEY